jgi:hypothetical protein
VVLLLVLPLLAAALLIVRLPKISMCEGGYRWVEAGYARITIREKVRTQRALITETLLLLLLLLLLSSRRRRRAFVLPLPAAGAADPAACSLAMGVASTMVEVAGAAA